MPRPHREIPSQRLAVARSEAPASPPRPHRSAWWTAGIIAVGWALLAYPVALLAVLSMIVMTGSLDSTVTAYGVAVGILGLLASLAMAVFPLLLGLAVKTRRRALWFAAILTGVLTVAMCAYLAVEWLIPLG